MQDGDENLAQLAGEAVAHGVRADDGRHCPSCRKDIGLWPVFTAGLPDRIRCPHCRCRLRYENATGVVVLLLAALAGAVYGGFQLARFVFPSSFGSRNILFAAVVLAVWIPVEWAVVRFLRARRRLGSAG
jgi:hypothetical protein